MNGKSVYRQVLLLAAFVLAAVVALIWSNRGDQSAGQSASDAPDVTAMVQAVAGVDTILSRTVDLSGPVTALAALEQAAARDSLPLGIREYDFGRLVVSIGGVTAGPQGDWTYTVNDEFQSVGAGTCLLQDGDCLTFLFGPPSPDSL